MLKKLLFILIVLFLLFAGIGMMLPATAHVERTTVIDRPASTIFTILNGYTLFSSWSPWALRDPDIVYAYSGPESGQGARMDWVGEPRLVGSGWQEIIASKPWSLIETAVDFEQQGEAIARFRIEPVRPGTRVTWTFDSNLVAGDNFLNGIINRYFGLLFDKWIGADYEEGLGRLKSFAESMPAADFSDLEVDVVDVEALDILYVTTQINNDASEISDSLASAYGEITAFMAASGLAIESQPLAITRTLGDTGFQIEAAIPVSQVPAETTGNIRSGKTPYGRAVRAIHHGSLDRLIETHQKLDAYLQANGLIPGAVTWEQYMTNPGTTAEDTMVTHIYVITDS